MLSYCIVGAGTHLHQQNHSDESWPLSLMTKFILIAMKELWSWQIKFSQTRFHSRNAGERISFLTYAHRWFIWSCRPVFQLFFDWSLSLQISLALHWHKNVFVICKHVIHLGLPTRMSTGTLSPNFSNISFSTNFSAHGHRVNRINNPLFLLICA